MNKLKKLLAVLVCTAMALTLVPAMTANAEGTPDKLECKLYDDHVEITNYYSGFFYFVETFSV